MGKVRRRLVFDLETEPFSESFRFARSHAERRKHAPKMRVACVFDEVTGSYSFFGPSETKALVSKLLSADEVISFNGKGFDVLVLQRHCALKVSRSLPTNGTHTDMHEIMSAEAKFRVSLDSAARLNLGEGKHTDGRAMSGLPRQELEKACQSDVLQTYRLWRLYCNGELRFPEKVSRDWRSADLWDGPGSHMPDICPVCHDVGSIEFVDADTEDMTEGQLAEYLAGTWGFLFCFTCKHQEFWEM